MNQNEINKASSQLSQAIRYFAPMIDALNGADEVLAILTNAVLHKERLLREIAESQKNADELKAQAEDSKKAITQHDAAAVEAKAAAEKAIADAQASAQTQIESILASVAEQTQKATDAFSAKQAEIAEATAKMEQEYSASVAGWQAKEKDLTASVATLEAKLDKLKEQAKKFAASLAVE
jgi:chromosome segregation ATPase